MKSGISLMPSSRSQPNHSRDDRQDSHTAQGLAESRASLAVLDKRLRGIDRESVPAELISGQCYWLYEHLSRLSLATDSLLERLEALQLEFSAELGDVITECVNPLEGIRDDLLAYYWRRNCLMEKLAKSKVDEALVKTIRDARKNYLHLASAVREYMVVRQEEDSHDHPTSLLVTGDALNDAFLAFATTLSTLVNSNGFKSRRRQLSKSLDSSPRTPSAQPRNRQRPT
jgi:hypothetical protein